MDALGKLGPLLPVRRKIGRDSENTQCCFWGAGVLSCFYHTIPPCLFDRQNIIQSFKITLKLKVKLNIMIMIKQWDKALCCFQSTHVQPPAWKRIWRLVYLQRLGTSLFLSLLKSQRINNELKHPLLDLAMRKSFLIQKGLQKNTQYSSLRILLFDLTSCYENLHTHMERIV